MSGEGGGGRDWEGGSRGFLQSTASKQTTKPRVLENHETSYTKFTKPRILKITKPCILEITKPLKQNIHMTTLNRK